MHPYCCIHICIKCHAARAAVEVVFAVDLGFWEGNVPRRKVEFSWGIGDEGDSGVTTNGNCVSSTVPLMSVS